MEQYTDDKQTEIIIFNQRHDKHEKTNKQKKKKKTESKMAVFFKEFMLCIINS